ncbi:MAG: GH92 family glycosyl hydrolase [Spirochaetia bacterium]
MNTGYVNPFIDTAKPRIRWIFSVFASRPAGLVRLSPDTAMQGCWDSGYRYNDPKIQCFSHLHSWQLAALPVMPVPDPEMAGKPDAYAASFSHDDESAGPGFYQVFFPDRRIQAEITATDRTGFHRYRFRGSRNLVIDLGAPLGPCEISDCLIEKTGPSILSGWVENEKTSRRPKRVRIYFRMEFSADIRHFIAYREGSRLAQSSVYKGTGLSAAASFKGSGELLVKASLSFTGSEGADGNMKEIAGWDFDRVKSETLQVWDEYLSRVEAEGGSRDHKVKLYTDLWRSLTGPQCISDTDGKYCDTTGDEPVVRKLPPDNRGSSRKRVLHGQDGYWAGQWSIFLVHALLYPDIMDDECNYLLDMARRGGMVPRGPSGGNYTEVMISSPGTPYLVSAWLKGIRSFDPEEGFTLIKRNHLPGGMMGRAGYEHNSAAGGGIEFYMDRGYVPEGIQADGIHRDGAAMTMEYAYQDWCLANFAHVLKKQQDEEYFRNRSLNYRNLFDKSTGFIRPRTMNGDFIDPFDPLSLTGFCEANSWQYTFQVPQDLPGMVKLMGGAQSINRKLEYALNQALPNSFYAPKPDLHRDKAYVNYGNEPGRYIAHLFNRTGAPGLAQKWTRLVKECLFSSVSPEGFREDDDAGKAAATSLLFALGLFDFTGGCSLNPSYEITVPLFDKITFHLHPDYYPGKEVTVLVDGSPAAEPYIEKIQWNGEELREPFILHRQFVSGGELLIKTRRES